MNQQLRRFDFDPGSGVPISNYFLPHPGSVDVSSWRELPLPEQSASMTRVAEDQQLMVELVKTISEINNILRDILSKPTVDEAALSFLRPKKSGRLKVITHDRGKGEFLTFD